MKRSTISHRPPGTSRYVGVRSLSRPVLAALVTAGTGLALGGGGRPTTTALLSHDMGVAYTAGGALQSRAGSAGAKQGFGISGSADGLYPGASRSLTLTVTNPFPFSIVVTTISTTVSAASSTCGATNLSVATFAGQLSVQAKGTSQTNVTATMAHGAPNACQGVSFPLQYSGSATR